jgi:PAS domain S-box-containing protein
VNARGAAPLVVSPGEPPWAGALHGTRAETGAEVTRAEAEAAGVVLIDGALTGAVATARRLRTLDPTLQPVLVACDEAERTRLERSLLFAPGLGELWVVTAAEVDAELAERAAAVTAQRRRYRGTRRTVQAGLARAEPRRAERTLVSDAFLAALMEVLPDPILSLDEEGRILSWNPAAERQLGYTREEALGAAAITLLRPRDTAALRALLEEGRRAEARAELVFHRSSGESGIAEIAVAPAHAAGHDVRALVLHEVTHLREAQAELEAQAAELENTAAEMEMLNAGLEERTAALEEAQSTRSRFYAAMSHELRTPINAVIGYVDLIMDGIYGPVPERQDEALRRSRRAAEHLLELVNDVLDLAKIEAGRIEMDPEPTHVPLLLRELLDTVRPLADEHGTTLALRDTGDCATIHTDPRRVRQILLNLLSNAIKFGEGKPVRITCAAADDGAVEVAVRDKGRGIAVSEQGRIFEEFVQLGQTAGGGTGLGLPISRRLAELLGGALTVRSAPGEGSTFTLHLPARLPGS